MDLERRIRVGLQRFQQTPAEPTISEENEEEPASEENKNTDWSNFTCFWSNCFNPKHSEETGLKEGDSESPNNNQTVITSERNIRRQISSTVSTDRQSCQNLVSKKISTSSIGSSNSSSSEKSKRSGDSFYQTVLDKLSQHWSPSHHKNLDELSAFPHQFFNPPRRLGESEEFGKDTQRLFMWSPNIGMVSFGIKNQSTISC